MTGDVADAGCESAVGQGDAGTRRAARGRGDTGHHLAGDAVLGENSASSLPRPKTKGSPPLSRTRR